MNLPGSPGLESQDFDNPECSFSNNFKPQGQAPPTAAKSRDRQETRSPRISTGFWGKLNRSINSLE
ncbi:hypothetical protein [Cupriavidus laharis]|uniref:hypothetical protein n=1 Tax=Cupriavidus laharis TaxID=151654 RepID=UPI001CC7D981|nr:hypothetical protein [Cupriavidus laharis]